MKRTRLSSKDFVRETAASYNLELTKKDTLELAEDTSNKPKIILLNGQPAFFYYGEKLIPLLKYLQQHELLKKVTVDMGAIKFIVNGADVMRPGIVAIDDNVHQDEPVVIIDEKNKKPIAVGFPLLDGADLMVLKNGKAVKIIHYVGDALWNIEP